MGLFFFGNFNSLSHNLLSEMSADKEAKKNNNTKKKKKKKKKKPEVLHKGKVDKMDRLISIYMHIPVY